MSFRLHDPRALIILVPVNDRARELLTDPDHSPCTIDQGDIVGFDIGHRPSSSGEPSTLATVGRAGDIKLRGTIFSKIHCSFEIHETSKVVLFCDRSSNQSCQVFGKYPFEHGRPRRQVVESPDYNFDIGIGGEKKNLYQFRLHWLVKEDDQIQQLNTARMSMAPPPAAHLARTIDDVDTTLQSARQTRLHTTGPQKFQMRFASLTALGSGTFGEVSKAVDIDSGDLIAVKIPHRPLSHLTPEERACIKREIELLCAANHKNIVQYIDASWERGAKVHIFTNLAEGDLESLAMQHSNEKSQIANVLFPQMLEALDSLAAKDLIHRDVKPENILYLHSKDGLIFQLTDFGLANWESMAKTWSGTPQHWAPEVCQGGRQTTKADVWSLYATMAWLLDEGFRKLKLESVNTGWMAIAQIAEKQGHKLWPVRAMARVDAKRRASAAQILVRHYEGRGLTTARLQIPPLEDDTPALQTEPTPQGLTTGARGNAAGTRGNLLRAGAQEMLPEMLPATGVQEKLPELPAGTQDMLPEMLLATGEKLPEMPAGEKQPPANARGRKPPVNTRGRKLLPTNTQGRKPPRNYRETDAADQFILGR